MEDASGTDHVRCGEGGLSLPSPVEGGREGESGRNELLRGPFALFGVRIGMLSSGAPSGRDKVRPALNARDTQRPQASGRGRYTRRSLSFRRKPSGRRRYCRHLPAEKERMISGRTFARESIALRQRKAKRAGRILALQGQNPGQLSFELIRSSERICP